jgi:hypothetical protein
MLVDNPGLAVLCSRLGCQRQRDADLQTLVDTGHGDAPLVELRWRCECHSARIDMVCMSRDSAVVAW